jgi:esterase/lipase superfamily enzyme
MDRRLLLGIGLLVFLTGCGQAPPQAAKDRRTAQTPDAAEDPGPSANGETEAESMPPELPADEAFADEAAPHPPEAMSEAPWPDEEQGDEPVMAPMTEGPDELPPAAALERHDPAGEGPTLEMPAFEPPKLAPRKSVVPSVAPQPSPPTKSPTGATVRSPAVSDKGFTRVRIFYATDRLRSGDTPNESYSDQRRGEDAGAAFELGQCDVGIPYKHAPGEVERPSVWRLEFREDPAKHVVLLSVQPLARTPWRNDVRNNVAESPDRAALVFVHGFNVDFASAARRTAQMKYDLGFRGAAILYSWPAPSNYVECEGNAIWTLPHLMEFLTEYVQQSGAQRIHLIAHSMGTRVLTTALKELAASPAAAPVKYDQIVLAAPDIDAAIFKRQIAPRIVTAAERISIYSSSNDWALVASKKAHRYKRLGEGGENLTTFPEWRQIEVLDATSVDESLLGHSYYGDSPTILRDVRGVLSGLGAAARGLRAQADYYLFQARRTQLSE